MEILQETLKRFNRRVEDTVDQKFQKVVASMTNWQRHQWNKHLKAQPNHRKELAVAQAYANLDRVTREVKIDGLVVAHG